MILLIGGSTHTGKTLAAQRVLEKYSYPYLSIDHLKMGLIRSGICPFFPESPDEELTPFLWGIIKEIVKTAIENGQNLVVEGCYIPFDWKKDFTQACRERIRYVCLIFSENYIQRLEELEAIGNDVSGVEKAYAVQAGRELRVMVKPEEVDDLTAYQIAREIKEKIENELKYPGTIKVTVIRETRCTEEAK